MQFIRLKIILKLFTHIYKFILVLNLMTHQLKRPFGTPRGCMLRQQQQKQVPQLTIMCETYGVDNIRLPTMTRKTKRPRDRDFSIAFSTSSPKQRECSLQIAIPH